MTWPLLIAAAVFLIALWQLRYGVAAVIVLLPAYLIRTTIAGIPTTALELSIYALAIAALIDLLRHRRSVHRLKLPRTWWILFLVWTGAWILASVASTDRTASFGAFKAWLFDADVFAAVLTYCIRTSEDRLVILRAMLISGFIVALGGFVQLISVRSSLQDGRLSSFFHPVANYAAMYLGPIFVISLGLVVWKVFRGWLWWVMVGSIGLALVLTVSYAGYLAAAAGSFFLWARLPPGQLKRRLGWSATVIAIVAAIIIPQTKYFSEHFKTTNRSSGLVRTQIWVTSWALIQHQPLLGIGPNTFEANYRAEIPKHYFPPLEWLVAQPHNLYLALWLETGLLGLLAFTSIIVYWLRLVLKRAKEAGPIDRVIQLASLAAIISVLVHGLFDTPYFKNDLAIILVVVFLLPLLRIEQTKN